MNEKKKQPPHFLKKIMLSKREIKLILDSLDITDEDMDTHWKAEMVNKLQRRLKRAHRVAKDDEKDNDEEV